MQFTPTLFDMVKSTQYVNGVRLRVIRPNKIQLSGEFSGLPKIDTSIPGYIEFQTKPVFPTNPETVIFGGK